VIAPASRRAVFVPFGSRTGSSCLFVGHDRDVATLRLIGYWRSEAHPEYPDPRDLVDSAWDTDERHVVGTYLAGGTISKTYLGYSPCRICGENNGAIEFTDGAFAWPSGLAHYVDQHGVRLPQELVEHAVARMDEIGTSVSDPTWWLSATRR
jgi:hypothetical protein